MGKNTYTHKPEPIVDIIKNKGRANLNDIVEELGYECGSARYNNIVNTLAELKGRGVLLKEERDYLINPDWDNIIPRKKRTAHEMNLYKTKLVSILNKNPMTIYELEKRWKELGYEESTVGLSGMIKSGQTCGYLDSIGPKHGNYKRVYFVKGQINLARKRLKELRPGFRVSQTIYHEPAYQDILKNLEKKGPSTLEKINETFNLSSRALRNRLKKLRRGGLCNMVEILALTKGGGFRTQELFDGFSGEEYWYIPKNPAHVEKLSAILLKAIGKTGDITRGKKAAITHHLQDMNVPEEIIEKIKTELPYTPSASKGTTQWSPEKVEETFFKEKKRLGRIPHSNEIPGSAYNAILRGRIKGACNYKEFVKLMEE